VKCAEEVVASGAGGAVFVSDFLEWSWCDTWRWTWSRGKGCRGATSFHNYSCTPLNHTCSPWWRSVSVRWCVVEKECCVKDKKRRDLVRIPCFWTFEKVTCSAAPFDLESCLTGEPRQCSPERVGRECSVLKNAVLVVRCCFSDVISWSGCSALWRWFWCGGHGRGAKVAVAPHPSTPSPPPPQPYHNYSCALNHTPWWWCGCW